MSLINLIKNLDNTEKTISLGVETTKILRYTFVEKDTDAISTDIIDLAIAIKDGIDFIYKKNKRDALIESIRFDNLISLGFSNYENAIDTYDQDIDRFFKDFNIEEKYRLLEITDERKSIEIAKPIFGANNGVNAFPHPYQLRLKNILLGELSTNYNQRILVTMPTGAGKTVLAMETLVDIFRTFRKDKNCVQVVWVVDSKELSEQSLQSFQKIWKQKGDREIWAQRYFDSFKTLDNSDHNKITFAAFTLLTPRIENQDKHAIDLLSNTDFLIIDEAHGANANTYQKVILKYRELNPKGQIIGLTATPFRNDDSEYSSLKGMFHSYLELLDENLKKVESPIEYLMERKYLANLNFEILNSERNNSSNSDFYRNLHESVLTECINILSRRENTIIFAESKSHAIALNLYLRHNNIENELIVGETHPTKRKEYLSRFGSKGDSLSILVNHQILSTGIDVPGMNSIMILSIINSPTLALQIIGRAMRGKLNGGNETNTIYLTRDNQNKLQEYKILENQVLRN